jgi:outer membrane immunogenic protein
MRRINILFALLVVSVLTLNAQAPLQKGEKQFNAGFGLSGWGVPVYAGVDFGVYKDITVGVEGSFRTYSDNWANSSYSHTIFGFLGNGNYHFNSVLNIPREWDFYGGLNLGFYIWSSSTGYNGSNDSGLGLGLQVGGRYFFTNRFGINLEFNGGNSVSGAKFGISYKF